MISKSKRDDDGENSSASITATHLKLEGIRDKKELEAICGGQSVLLTNLARGWSRGGKRQMETPGGCVHLRGGGPGTRRGLSLL